jgi:exopolysaccharide production protein ExoQ
MVLIVVTDTQPIGALRRLYTRVGFILFPFSIVLIRYTSLGRAWDADGNLSIVGVTDNKNTLGLIAFVISLGLLWNLRWLLMNRGAPNRGRRLVAEGIVFVFGLYLLSIANSSTSKTCFLLGCALMLATHLRAFRRRPSRVNLLCLAALLVVGFALFSGGSGDVANALGRDVSFSGRTDIWAALIPAASNPIIGAGFESFWNSPNVLIFQHILSLIHWYHPERLNEAHNGYLEVYLNLGWIGVCLIAFILATGYLRAIKALRPHGELGSLMLAYIITGVFYNITEAGFRTLNPIWIFVLLAVVSVSGVNARLFADETTNRSQGRRRWRSLGARSSPT